MMRTERKWFKWIVLAGGFYTNTFIFSTLFSFGSLFNDLLDKFHENISRTAMVQALLNGVGLSLGIFSGLLISRFGIRRISLIGGIMASMGFILSFLATSIVHLYIYISVISGIGTSIIIISSATAVAQSFSGSQRLFALSIQHTGMSVGGALTPYLYDYFMESYGLNGTFLLIGGIYLNYLPAAILFPIPHQNRVKETNNEPKQSHKTASETRRKSTSELCISVIYMEIKQLATDIYKVMRPQFILTVLGVGLSTGSLGGCNTLILDILKWKGLPSDQALLAFPIMYGVGFIGRILPGIAKQIKGVSSFLCPIIFGLCGALGQLLFVLYSGTHILLVSCGFLGLAIAGVVTGANVVAAQILDPELISIGVGLIYSTLGILVTVYGAIYGTIRDILQSYDLVFYLTFAFQVFGTGLFLVATIVRKMEEKGTSRTLRGQDNLTITIEE